MILFLSNNLGAEIAINWSRPCSQETIKMGGTPSQISLWTLHSFHYPMMFMKAKKYKNCLLLSLYIYRQSDSKESPAMRESWVPSLDQEDPLKKGMAIHSSILAWRIPWTEEPGGLQSMELQRVRHDWAANSFTFTFIYRQNVLHPFPHSSQQSQQVYCNDIHLTDEDMKAQRDKLHLTCIASKNCNSFINQILVPQKWHPTLVEGSWEKLKPNPGSNESFTFQNYSDDAFPHVAQSSVYLLFLEDPPRCPAIKVSLPCSPWHNFQLDDQIKYQGKLGQN